MLCSQNSVDVILLLLIAAVKTSDSQMNHSSGTLHVQVNVHRDKLRIKQPTRCIKYPKLYFVIKLYMFLASSLPIIRSYLLYTRQLVCFMQVM
jgi:hypothetical protein